MWNSNLHILNHCNYYNRQIKPLQSLNDADIVFTLNTTNFNPNDGISTEHIFGDSTESYDGSGDYCVLTDNTENILSRWFIIECQRTRGGQWKVLLKRDVISDYREDVVNSPTFIEKAMLPTSDPGIFNPEAMDFNQIKESETLLQDLTKCPWIVGYVDRKLEQKTINIPSSSVKIDYTVTPNEGETALDAAKRVYSNSKYTAATPMYVNSYPTIQRYAINIRSFVQAPGVYRGYRVAWNQNGHSVEAILNGDEYSDEYLYYNSTIASGYQVKPTKTATETAKSMGQYASAASWKFNTSSYITSKTIVTNAVGNSFLADNGKIIQAGNNYYRIDVKESSVVLQESVASGSELGLQLTRVALHAGNDGFINYDTSKSDCLFFQAKIGTLYCELTRINPETFQIQIPGAGSRIHPSEQPYDIFCMPYGAVNYYGTGMSSRKDTSKELALKVCQTLIIELGNQLYDIQLLPYCPLDLNRIFTSALGEHVFLASYFAENTFTTIDAEGDYTFMGWISEPSFTRILDYSISVPEDNIEFKVANECTMWRLSSPNYSSSFEFSACKNRGVSKFRVDCTYKPFSPYIRCAPEFGGLYGEIQDDARGLICGGDFSLTQVNDAWVNYQLNNKNYNETFNRQLENMRFQNDISRKQENLGILTGALSAGVSGSMGLGMINPVAGVVGGIVSAGVSALAGAADYQMNEALRRETIDYTKDQFGYQLSNIKAQPTTLEKVSPFNANNKVFPVLEKYSATDIEKQALRDKITYNGMSVGRIGTINQFIQPNPTYIKGKLIRCQITEDYHVINSIAEEINKGVFI